MNTILSSFFFIFIFIALSPIHPLFSQDVKKDTTKNASTQETTIATKPATRAEMMRNIIKILQKEQNKRTPDVKIKGLKDSTFAEYYEISGTIVDEHITLQLLPAIEGRSSGSLSLSWDKVNTNKGKESWFISLSLQGNVETAYGPKNENFMALIGHKPAGKNFQTFWQQMADEMIQKIYAGYEPK